MSEFRKMTNQRAREARKGTRFLMDAGTVAVGVLAFLSFIKATENKHSDVSAQTYPDSASRHEKKSWLVQEMQEKLKALGYDLDADGLNGAHTRTQVFAFQKNNALKPTGELNSRTIRKIRNQYAEMKHVKRDERLGDTGSKLVRAAENVPGALVGFVGDIAEGVAKELP